MSYTVKYTYSSGTASGATVSWTGVLSGTYRIYAGNHSSAKTTLVDTGLDITVGSTTGTQTIDYYGVTVSQGTNTSLTVKYENNSGASFTETQYILKNRTIYVTASADTGYGLTLTGATSGSNTITASTTVATTATANGANITTTGCSSANVRLISKTDSTKSYTATASSNVATFTIIPADSYDIYASAADDAKSTYIDSGVDITVTGGNTASATITYYRVSFSSSNSTCTGAFYDSSKTTNYYTRSNSSYTMALQNSYVYVTGAASSGYGNLVLKYGNDTITSGTWKQVTAAVTISSSASDGQAPQISSKTYTGESETSATITVNATDNASGTLTYKFYLGNTLKSTQTSSTGSCSYTMTGLTTSTTSNTTPNTCYVEVIDGANNTTGKQSIAVGTKLYTWNIYNTESVQCYAFYLDQNPFSGFVDFVGRDNSCWRSSTLDCSSGLVISDSLSINVFGRIQRHE